MVQQKKGRCPRLRINVLIITHISQYAYQTTLLIFLVNFLIIFWQDTFLESLEKNSIYLIVQKFFLLIFFSRKLLGSLQKAYMEVFWSKIIDGSRCMH